MKILHLISDHQVIERALDFYDKVFPNKNDVLIFPDSLPLKHISKRAIYPVVTYENYEEIAKKYDSTVPRVERAIRHAIEISWNRGNWELMEDIFGHSIDIDKAKPTNSEFIITIADKIRLDYTKPLITN